MNQEGEKSDFDPRGSGKQERFLRIEIRSHSLQKRKQFSLFVSGNLLLPPPSALLQDLIFAEKKVKKPVLDISLARKTERIQCLVHPGDSCEGSSV